MRRRCFAGGEAVLSAFIPHRVMRLCFSCSVQQERRGKERRSGQLIPVSDKPTTFWRRVRTVQYTCLFISEIVIVLLLQYVVGWTLTSLKRFPSG